MTEAPATDGLRDILAEILTGAAGKTEEHWRQAVGEVEALPIHSNVRSNWRVKPTGNRITVATVEQTAEIVREAHPYGTGGH